MRETRRAVLELADGTRFEGRSFGYEASTSGEVVFNTAMTGYPESLTDPSYEGQILVATYPLGGNYGVPPTTADGDNKTFMSEFLESDRIHCRALVLQDYSWQHSHWLAEESLSQWLIDQKIPGIYDVDTRALTKHLRESGSMLGKIIIEGCPEPELYDPNTENLVAATSEPGIVVYTPAEDGKSVAQQVQPQDIASYPFDPARKVVVLVDCGVKHNIIRCLTQRGVTVVRVPWDFDFTEIPYDGLFISNGPGNPDFAEETVKNLRKAIELERPICGICMGNQLLAKAAGAQTYKLKYGHRSHNQPVRRADTNTCFITSQNHGFAVDNDTLPADWEPLFINMNDGTNEGIRHKSKPFFSAQFHPEASSGPEDTTFLFDEFICML
ncbi:MAG: glutamine-hydrolyzing carbamoyl-phosphate synthase small subunit [Muribaculaceae bacterium]|nr:glutamine-hydrolyzing carbamoyl-phosphate synthase small subunit [Muribaculaceae bacterium]